MKTKLTKREIWALKTMLEFDIARYLMANSCQRLDGAEKAEHHIAMSKVISKFIFAEGSKYEDTFRVNCATMAVHDYLAEILTDRMDEVIGFPINTPLYGDMYTPLQERFFNVIIDNFDEIEKVAKEAVKINY